MARIQAGTARKRLLAIALCALTIFAFVSVITIKDSGSFTNPIFVEFTQDSTPKWTARSNLTRADGPRVTFLVAQTKPSSGWCRMLVSSVFSNVSVVTLGVGKRYRHTYRPQWMLEYVEAERLRDEDVVVMIDGGDTVFTGALTMQKALQKFIAATAPTASAFDSASVRRGETLAPMMFGGDFMCSTPEARRFVLKEHRDFMEQCRMLFQNTFERAGMDNNTSTNLAEPGKSPVPYLNAGGIIARVWALKRATTAYRAMLVGKRGLWCDQSLWAVLYLWSLHRERRVPSAMVIPFGLIGIDFHFNFFLGMYCEDNEPLFHAWNETDVRKVVATGNVPFPLFFNIAGYPNATPMVFHLFECFQEAEENLQRNIPYLPWLREVHRDEHTLQRAKRRLTEDTLVDMRESAGTQRLLRFADVCPAEDVLSIQWLSTNKKK